MQEYNPNVIVTQYMVGMEDLVYHKQNPVDIIPDVIKPLVDSTRRFDVPVYLLTNTKIQPKMEGLKTINSDLFPYEDLTLYFHRIELTYQFLLEHPEVNKVAFVDAGDVKLMNFPFDQMEDYALYMGVESILLREYSFIRNRHQPKELEGFLNENGDLNVLNPGVTVGTRDIMLEYFGIMNRIVAEVKYQEKLGNPEYEEGMGPLEMGIFNYVAYKYFRDRLHYGRKVTSKMRAFEHHTSAWFAHK